MSARVLRSAISVCCMIIRRGCAASYRPVRWGNARGFDCFDYPRPNIDQPSGIAGACCGVLSSRVREVTVPPTVRMRLRDVANLVVGWRDRDDFFGRGGGGLVHRGAPERNREARRWEAPTLSQVGKSCTPASSVEATCLVIRCVCEGVDVCSDLDKIISNDTWCRYKSFWTLVFLHATKRRCSRSRRGGVL